ncbi:MAG: hypothetical protein ACKOAS_06930 [Verrucomicrobiota bacterium]
MDKPGVVGGGVNNADLAVAQAGFGVVAVNDDRAVENVATGIFFYEQRLKTPSMLSAP